MAPAPRVKTSAIPILVRFDSTITKPNQYKCWFLLIIRLHWIHKIACEFDRFHDNFTIASAVRREIAGNRSPPASYLRKIDEYIKFMPSESIIITKPSNYLRKIDGSQNRRHDRETRVRSASQVCYFLRDDGGLVSYYFFFLSSSCLIYPSTVYSLSFFLQKLISVFFLIFLCPPIFSSYYFADSPLSILYSIKIESLLLYILESWQIILKVFS